MFTAQLKGISNWISSKYFLCCSLLIWPFVHTFAQTLFPLSSSTPEHIFTRKEIDVLEDESANLRFDDIQQPRYQQLFQPNTGFYPKNRRKHAAYWCRVKIKVMEQTAGKWLLELFDQTTEDVAVYVPDEGGIYHEHLTGAGRHFTHRLFRHKNFEFNLEDLPPGEYNIYFRIRSQQPVNIIIVLRSIGRFIQYGLTEYLLFGLFYGMILTFSFHNLLMFMAMRKVQYLFYVLYILSVGVYEMCSDGIAFQYIWPSWPAWNQYAYGFCLYLISIFALLFVRALLPVRSKTPILYQLINLTLLCRTVYFVICIFFRPDWFIYKFVEFVPLALSFVTGLLIWKKGYKPARFFVLGYSFLLFGFIVRLLVVLGLARLLPGYIIYYSLSLCFIIEMVFLSFSMSDEVKFLRRKKEDAQRQIIEQMELNAILQDKVNQELEQQVNERTKELQKKSKELAEQSMIIEKQNQDLRFINNVLYEQKEEITRMNALLQKDNLTLKTNIQEVTDARLQAKAVEFEEFSLKYPDKESCYKFLAELKWQHGYVCVKCGHENYCNGKLPYSRRCTKCTYEESALHNTIFENNRIPINKAFYLVYLVYNYKGNISSHKLAEKLGIRQSTCWSYSSKIKKVMDERKKKVKTRDASDWRKLILNT